MNLALDDTPELSVLLHTTCQSAALLTPDGPRGLDATPAGHGLLVRVPPMRAWDTAVLIGA